MRHIIATGLIVTAILMAASCADSGAECRPAGDLRFVCGLIAKRGQALTASGTYAAERYGACPGPLDSSKAVLHGLSLRPVSAGRHTLYATNHGGRESIEVFDIDVRGATPVATWIGCVVLPEGMAANSVAAFSDGTLVATVLMLPGTAFEDIFAGRNTGVVLMWTPGSTGFTRLDGTELSGNKSSTSRRPAQSGSSPTPEPGHGPRSDSCSWRTMRQTMSVSSTVGC
jgi:hypothetical protein